MLLSRWTVQLAWCLVWYVHVAAGLQLFQGQPYTGSAEQHAEIDAITAAAQAKRADYAACLQQTPQTTQSNLTAAIDKHKDIAQTAVDEAQRLVNAAMERWASTYQPHVVSPRRNTYTSRHTGANAGRQPLRRSADGVADTDTTDAFATTAAAAALLAELEAAERARNGTLYRTYTFHAPDSPIQQAKDTEAKEVRMKKRERARKAYVGGRSLNKTDTSDGDAASTTYWLEQMAAADHGHAPFAPDAAHYKVFRNVKDYGAKGDGVTDDTAAINKAISDGKRCGADCLSSTTQPALVYFPAGTYLVSSTIIGYYQTQLVGNPNSRPTIRAASKFVGKDGTTGVISSDVYIDGGGGQKWYLETSNFYRQVRNLIIDIEDVKAENASCFHWQVAQATSIENVACYMSKAATTTQRGIFCENGSGGWMADLTFSNGQIGIYGGEQQFTAVSVQFIGCKTGVQFIWDWGWTWRSIYVGNADVAFQLFDAIGGTESPGSFLLQDATISNCKTGILTRPPRAGNQTETTNIVLDTVAFNSVDKPVADTKGGIWLTSGGSSAPPLEVTQVWTLGTTYVQGASGSNTLGDSVFGTGVTLHDAASRPARLVAQAGDADWSSRWYKVQRKPQYETVDINLVINLKDYGAKGDGVTDDTAAFKSVFGHAFRSGGIVFIPHGVYLLSDTVELEAGVMVVGECWSQLMAKGSSFSGLQAAKPLVRVGIPGNKGDQGFAELSDLLITSKGTASHLVGLEWNMRGAPSGTMPGVYDVHVRIGGATGTDLQVAQCPQGQGTTCQAGLLMIHITPGGGGYFQNVWAWVADHDIDDAFNDRVNVLVARGWLIESTEPVWLYGTATEHAVMYQYSFSGASTVSAGMIQTESGYFQGKDGVRNPLPFANGLTFSGDPVLPSGGCVNGTIGCDSAWAVVIQNSTNITIDGAGLYTWFDAYDETCVDSWNCQESLVQIDAESGDISIKNLITIGATHMVSGARADEAFLGVDAAPNLNAYGHPWWSVLASFAIVGSPRTKVWPANRNFFGLGDSYASGIGADCGKISEDEPKGHSCNKCRGAYAYQLAHNFPPFNGHAGEPSSLFKFYACAGAKTSGVTDPPAPGKVSQVRQMKDYNNFVEFGFATLSIGGNDVGFARIVSNCLFWNTKICEDEWTRTNERIASLDLVRNLTQAYTNIMDVATVPNFKLYVTGYARFFNEHTDWCNDQKLFPYAWVPGSRIELTRELRARANAMTVALNTVLSNTVLRVNAQYQRAGSHKRAIFVDTDTGYENFRWCDGLKRNSWRDDSYFFNVRSKDLLGDGSLFAGGAAIAPGAPDTSHELLVVDIGGLNLATCLDDADAADDDSMMMRCVMARLYASNSNSNGAAHGTLGTVYPVDGGDGSANATLQIVDNGGLTTTAFWDKAFHPKTYPLAKVAGSIFQRWMYLR